MVRYESYEPDLNKLPSRDTNIRIISLAFVTPGVFRRGHLKCENDGYLGGEYESNDQIEISCDSGYYHDTRIYTIIQVASTRMSRPVRHEDGVLT